MFNKRTFIILKRELKTRLFSKSFIVMTLLIPIFLIGILAIQTFVMTFEGDKNTRLHIVSDNQDVLASLKGTIGQLEFVKNNYYNISFEALGDKKFDDLVNTKKQDVLSEKLTGIIFVPSSAVEDKEIKYYSVNPNNRTIFDKLKGAINEALTDLHFSGKNLSREEIAFARKNVNFDGYRVTQEEQIVEEGFGNFILSFLFTFFLYFSLLIMGQTLMRAVVEEKSNKIVEILLSSVNARELMAGKIFGSAITGVMQMAIWLLPVVILVTTSIFTLPADFNIKISLGILAYFLLNYFVALITFLGLFAAVGAMFDNDQDTQAGIWPIMMLIMIPFFIAMGMQQNANNTIAKVTSFLPFGSLIVMPARMTLIDLPLWQIVLSFVVNLATMFVVFPLSGKIYRVGILMTGKKPTYSDVIKWLKYKY